MLAIVSLVFTFISFVSFFFFFNRLIDPNKSQRIQVLPDGTLQIAEARASDVGTYACQVTSAGGDDSRQAKLYVIELPYPPNGVAATRLGTGKLVNVSWIAGFDGNSPISKFIVQKRVVPVTGPIPDTVHSWTTEVANVSSDVRWFVLPSLKAAAAYQFRVSAVNSVGEGQPSEASNRVTLPQEVPTGPPVGLVGSARSASQIMIQWQPPEEEHRNGQITGFMVRYRLHGYGDGSPWSYRNISTEVILNALLLLRKFTNRRICFFFSEPKKLLDRRSHHLERLRNSNGGLQ